MTRRDSLNCVHEPFGDAFYYGPERLSERYEGDEEARVASGFSRSTYQSVLESIEQQQEEVRPPSVRSGQDLSLNRLSFIHCLERESAALVAQFEASPTSHVFGPRVLDVSL